MTERRLEELAEAATRRPEHSPPAALRGPLRRSSGPTPQHVIATMSPPGQHGSAA